MSYPPPPPPPSGQPPSGQPWQGPPPPYQQGQPHPPVAPPPIAPPPYSPSPYGPPPPRKRRTGLVIGLAALVLALVGVIGVGTWLLLTRDDDGSSKAVEPVTTEATPSPTTEPSPTAPPTSDAPSASAPQTPYAPTDDTGDDITGDVSAADFPGDWDFKYDDVEHHATYEWSKDYDTCAPVEKGAVLTQKRCEHASQWTYSALGGKATVTHIFLVFDTEPHAKSAQQALTDADLDLAADSLEPGWETGQWNSSVYGNIVGVTVGTATAGVKEKKLISMVNYMNTDYRSALMFML